MALYTSPEGKTYEVDRRFGHALEALGWTTDNQPDPQEVTEEPADDRGKWKKADWLFHAGSLGLDVDEKDTLDVIKAAIDNVEK